MNNMIKILVAMWIGIALTSCNLFTKHMVDAIPMLSKINANKEMDESTKRGMFDGCFTGYHSRGTSFYKTMLYFRQDPRMVSNKRYMFAWGRGYVACFGEAISWSHMPIGGKAFNTDSLGAWISPVGQKVQVPIGGDAESQPAVWYFDESINRGIPGTANYGTNHNFFGAFGTCYLC